MLNLFSTLIAGLGRAHSPVVGNDKWSLKNCVIQFSVTILRKILKILRGIMNVTFGEVTFPPMPLKNHMAP